MSTKTTRRKIVVQHGDVRHDIAIAPDFPIGVSLQGIGVDPADPALIALDLMGQRVDLSTRPERALRDGSVLTFVDLSAAPVTPEAAVRTITPHRSARPRIAWWLAAIAAIVLIVTAMMTLSDAGPRAVALGPVEIPAWARFAVGGVLWVLAAVVAVEGASRSTPLASARRPLSENEAKRRPVGIGALAVGPLLACAATMLLTPAVAAAQVPLMLFLGLASAAVVSAIAAVAHHGCISGPAATLLAIVMSLSAALFGATLMLNWPTVVAAAILVGAVPPVLRALPAWCLDVPDAQLVDIAENSDMNWTVRGKLPGGAEPVHGRRVTAMVRGGELQRDTGTVILSAIPALAMPWIFAATPSGTVEWWGAVALASLTFFAMVFQPRGARDPLSRWAPRAGAAVLLGEMAIGAALSFSGTAVALASVALIVALAIAALSVPLSRGYRGLGPSRIADTVEKLAVTLSLPAGLVAAGLIEILRAVTSG